MPLSTFGLDTFALSQFTTGPFHFYTELALGVVSATELDGATISIIAGSEMEQAVSAYFRREGMFYEPVFATDVEEAVSLFELGASDILVVPTSAIPDADALSAAGYTKLPERIRLDPSTDNTLYVFAYDEILDFSGVKLVQAGGIEAETVTELGASPVKVPLPEWFAALQTGVVDGIIVQGAADRDTVRVVLGDEISLFVVGEAEPVGATSGDDDLSGTRGDDTIKLLAGDDVYSAGKGNDTVWGGAGNDEIHGGAGKDFVKGGKGADTFWGDGGRDKIFGNSGNDVLRGGAGGDVMKGGGGKDLIEGGSGADKLFGGGGADILNGGRGNDAMTGGAGADVFVYAFSSGKNRDTINDFRQGVDEILVENLDYSARVVDGNTILKFGSGQTLTLKGFTDKKALKDDISLIEEPAPEGEPLLAFGLGGIFDKGINESAYLGAGRWAAKTGASFRYVEPDSEAQYEQILRRVAEAGNDLVVAVGAGYAGAMDRVAMDAPDTSFAIIDAFVEQPNVTSYTFAVHEGAYLMGMFAALASEAQSVGFIGGMDIALTRRYATAFEAGVEAIDDEIAVFVNMVGTTPAAWNDPRKGAELAKAQITLGADVIYTVAAGSSIGVLQAVADADILGIGNGYNLNYLHPGSMLTSMMTKVDVVVEDVFDLGDTLPSGLQEVGLAEGAIGYAVDEFNETHLTIEMRSIVDDAIADIISGELTVPDYLDGLV